ncbi:MAG: flippase [Patescibacteria group bacterium]
MFTKLRTLLLQNKSTKQTIVKNFFWLTFAQVASRFIRAAIIIYAARILGAGEYGVFSYALGLVGFFSIFADVGINSILTREAAQNQEKRSDYFATAFWIKLILLTLTSILVISLAPHFSKIEAALTLIPIVVFLSIFDGVRELTIAFVRAAEKMELEALIIILTNITITVIGFIALFYSPTVKAFVLAYVGSAGIGTLISIIILRKEFAKIFSHFRMELVRPIIDAAMPIALVVLAGIFMVNTDILFLGWLRTSQEIGLYSSAQKIFQTLNTLPGILASAFFPTISKLVGQKRNEEVRYITEKGVTILLLLSAPIAIGGVILAKPIIVLLYGPTYAPAAIVFQIFVATAIFFPSALIANLILAYNKQKSVVKYIFLANLANILLNLLLIPHFGIAGASIATGIAQTISVFAGWMIVKKTNNFHTLRYLKHIGISVAIMGFASFVLNKFGLHVLFNVVISGALYFFLLYILKEPTIKEVLVIARKAVTRFGLSEPPAEPF